MYVKDVKEGVSSFYATCIQSTVTVTHFVTHVEGVKYYVLYSVCKDDSLFFSFSTVHHKSN